MIIGYGYNRPPEALTELGADRVFIDMPGTHRQERAAMLSPGVIREGDTLAVLALGDLGRGKETRKVMAAIKSAGANIEVPKAPTKYNAPGRPRRFRPNAAQDSQIKALYRSYLTLRHVLDRASEIMGSPVERHQLVYRYGKRWPE